MRAAKSRRAARGGKNHGETSHAGSTKGEETAKTR
jgi:hypothetical protein